MIEVDGKKYKVIENLGYVQDVGMQAKVCKTETGERVAVKCGFKWRWWKTEIRPGSDVRGQL